MKQNRISLFALTLLCAALFPFGLANAVIVNIDLTSEGEPLPNASVTLETPEGEPIDVTEKTETPDTPETDVKQPETTEDGKIIIEVDDKHKDKEIVVVIRKDDRIVKKQPVRLRDNDNTISISVPAISFLMEKTQGKKPCAPGTYCRFEFKVTNTGLNAWNGPLILSDQMPVSVRHNRKTDEDWQCGQGKRGQTLCLVETASLAPGADIATSLALNMARRTNARNSNNCASVLWPSTHEQLGTHRPTIQILQLAARLRGIKVGKADGVMGPKTRRAFTQLLDESDNPPNEMSVATLFTALGWQAMLKARPDLSYARHCVDIVETKKPRPRVTERRKKPRHRKSYSRDERIRIPVDVGISIGLGLIGRRHHKKRRRYKEPRRHRGTYKRY